MSDSSASIIPAHDLKAGDCFNPYDEGMFLNATMRDDFILDTETGVVDLVAHSNNRVCVFFKNLSGHWTGMDDTPVILFN